ncbi:MAG: SDR family oxidoreductase [Bdellovibrionales bacterium]|nr:SDR family oxidoreductase [Bdellovibrionales bacterium]
MMNKIETSGRTILLTGCTGYVGGRLLQLLEERRDITVRCIARSPENVHSKSERTEVVRGDVLDPKSLESALKGIHTAYFLVHALGSKYDFEEKEVQGAKNFATAARNAGVQRIIYLGGLGKGDALSPHLRSRHAVGEILRGSGIQTFEFRASIIIGSGSLSFDLVRSLTEKLPIMITPKWVRSLAQPIAIRNVLEYLIEALDHPGIASEVYEIGGPDRVPYSGLMHEYAQQRGLGRLMIPVPVLSPRLSSLWLGLVTPVYARIGRKLIDSLAHDTVVTDRKALQVFSVQPMGVSEAIARAIKKEDELLAETHWYDALSSSGTRKSWGGVRFGSRIIDSRTQKVAVPAHIAFKPIAEIGGKRGWYFANVLWHLRGLIDLIVGGVGMRRGRPHPRNLRVGDPIDFWRVEAFQPGKILRLHAEMKLPGRAWLQFEITPEGESVIVTQTAIFDPIGVFGLLYWYALYPVHALIFSRMLRALCRAAEREYQRKDLLLAPREVSV